MQIFNQKQLLKKA